MNAERIKQLREFYKSVLLDDVMPFWLNHALDRLNGGYYTYLDRDGSLLSTDKSVWIQGRGTWIYAKLYNTLEKRPEWLDAAKIGYEFLIKHCFDTDGRMFFQVTEDGRPLRKRRYWYSETFAIIGLAEYAKATGDEFALQKAKDTYKTIVDLYRNPEKSLPKYFPETRSTKSHAESMILIATTQTMREVDDSSIYKDVVDTCMDQVFSQFLKRDRRALLETVGKNGEFIDNQQGRCVNPGHAIETAWFLMHEGIFRKDRSIIKQALEILDWSFELGWDKEYGGIFYFVDVDGKSPEQLEWDMKLWWPHIETLYALLLAYSLTKDEKYSRWYELVHEWSFKRFSDHEYGDWYGYLHRDGSISLPVKGTSWKGPFHLPRFLLYGMKLLEHME